MKKSGILLLLIALAYFPLQAQKYRTAAGIRLGDAFGLTIQQKILKSTTIEGILQTSLGGADDVSLTLLYEQHQKILSRRLNLYYGAGFHKAWLADNPDNARSANAGITGIFGAEVTFGRLNLSVDYKPLFNVFNGDRFFQSNSALSVRYVFLKAKKKKFNWKFWKKD